MPRTPGSWFRILVLTLVAATVVVLGGSSASQADPGAGGSGDDGSAPTLQGQLEQIAEQLAATQARLTEAKQQQAALKVQLIDSQNRMAELSVLVGGIANAEYRVNPAATVNALLDSQTPTDFLRRFGELHEIAQAQNAEIVAFHNVQAQYAATKASLDRAIAAANNQEAELKRQQQAALRILNHATGGPDGVIIAAATASPAPRNSDGSLSDSCNQHDPTSGGCLTAPTLHAYQEVKKAGFDHYVHCWRTQSWGEHPKGRACDWACDVSGFGGVASGSTRTYCNKLAGFLIGNSVRLGVLYVIWFRQIWLPGVGWHAYTTEGGNPSGRHENHVHMSIR
jgi:peptidoglycan DL-endopeptidase CwlO